MVRQGENTRVVQGTSGEFRRTAPATHHSDSRQYSEIPATQPLTVSRTKPHPAEHKKSIPNDSSTAAPSTQRHTFFDGSYFSSTSDSKRYIRKNRLNRPAFNYSIPTWSYLYNSVLVAFDILMVLLAATIVFVVRPEAYVDLQNHNILGDELIEYLIFIVVAWLISLALCHGYERHIMGEGYQLYSVLIKATFAFFIALCAVSYMFKLNMSRSLTFLIPLFTGLLSLIERWLMRRALHRNRNKGEFTYQTIVVGSPGGLYQTLAQLERSKGLGYKPIAVCPVERVQETGNSDAPQVLIPVAFEPVTKSESELRILSMNSHLPQTAKTMQARTILIADVIDSQSETMRTLSLATESMGIELAFTANVADIGGATLHLRNDPSMPVFTAKLPQYSGWTRLLKRAMDIILSATAIILTSPIMAFVAIRVKAEDGGPAMYMQQRIGLYGKPFKLYKFRSMSVNADKQDKALANELGADHGILFKAKDDPRITKFGHFIRKTSLDELP